MQGTLRKTAIEVEATGKLERSLISVGIDDETALEMTDERNRGVVKPEKEKKNKQKSIKHEKTTKMTKDRNQGLSNRMVV